MSTDLTADQLSQIDDPDHFPARVGRVRRRKGETFESWRERAIEYRKVHPPRSYTKKEDREYVDEDRFEETLENARTHFLLDDEAIKRYSKATPDAPLWRNHITETERSQRTQDFYEERNLSASRLSIYEWVEKFYTLRLSEANCNLDCVQCPAAIHLNCVAQNRTAAARDGFLLPPTPHRGES